MSTADATFSVDLPPSVLPLEWSLQELREHLGGVPLARIRLYPPPGMATEQDAFNLRDREDRLYELVDGALVEKAVGAHESVLAAFLISRLQNFLDEYDWGVLLAPDGPFRLSGRLRMPDVAFVSWDKFPGRKLSADRVWALAPDLAVEIISRGNTKAEMENKLTEYFETGVRLVWFIDPRTRSAAVYTARDEFVELDENGALDGGDVLKGFSLPLRDVFDRFPRE